MLETNESYYYLRFDVFEMVNYSACLGGDFKVISKTNPSWIAVSPSILFGFTFQLMLLYNGRIWRLPNFRFTHTNSSVFLRMQLPSSYLRTERHTGLLWSGRDKYTEPI
jgi:hypothetical protein